MTRAPVIHIKRRAPPPICKPDYFIVESMLNYGGVQCKLKKILNLPMISSLIY